MTNIIQIPFNKLTISPENPRKAPVTKDEHKEMVASILARGVMLNLLVKPASKKGHYLVVDGGLRLKAFKDLVERGDRKATENLPCAVVSDENGLDNGLAANRHRTKMHPVDEYEAFAELRKDGMTVKEIATRNHLSTAAVNQRLTLGTIAPVIREACRAGEITVDVLKAFSVAKDIERQLEVWNDVKNNTHVSPYHVRTQLTEGKIRSDSSIALFVGEKAYKKARGFVSKDLFEDVAFFDDSKIVEQLAQAKLEKALKPIAEPWKWGSAKISFGYQESNEYGREYPEPVEVPEDLTNKLGRLQAEIEKLDNLNGDDWTDEVHDTYNALELKSDEIETKIEDCAVFSEDQYGRAGVVVAIGNNGELEIHKGLVVPSDAPLPSTNATEAGQSDGVEVKAARPVHSNVLVDDMKSWRLPVIQLALASNPDAALDLLLYDLVASSDYAGYRNNQGTGVTARATYQPSSLHDLDAHPANIELTSVEEEINKLVAVEGNEDLFAHISGLAPADKQRCLAWFVSRAVCAGLGGEKPDQPVLEVVGQRLEVDVAKYWRPTATNYLNRIRKDAILDIGDYILGNDAGFKTMHLSDAKATAVSLVGSLLKGEYDGMTEEQLQRAAAWLPSEMSYVVSAEEETAGTEDDEGVDPETGLPTFLSGEGDTMVEISAETDEAIAA